MNIINIIFLIVYFIPSSFQLNNVRVGSSPTLLFVDNENNLKNNNKPFMIDGNANNLNRLKRSADDVLKESTASLSKISLNKTGLTSSALNDNSFDLAKNQSQIFVKTNNLNDSHAQLMVHWLGEGTNVLICLARDPPPSPLEIIKNKPHASSVFISYDYGNTFEDKTSEFKVIINGTEQFSTLDQFMTHPKYNTIVFTDPHNQVIFTSDNNGKTIKSHRLNFHPSDVSFYEIDPKTFLVLDKEDPERKLYYTIDFGVSFEILQSYVKSFIWSSGDGLPTHLYVERKEPTNTSSVLFINASHLIKDGTKKFNPLIENVQDFQIKKDFMFAIRKVLNNTILLISYKRNGFVRAEFQTELEIRGIHIVDVTGKRILVSVVHSETIAHLYASESDNDLKTIRFVLSLENIFTYIPDLTWKATWLAQSSDEAFTDIYKVDGLRGIYIASKQNRITHLKTFTITPEHLVSVITFDHGATWNPIRAPTVDDEGQLINCTRDCSLHLSQKFSQLYPVTRSVNIMSSKLAPGVIMASGVIGKSLKGHPGIFISRDAGITWKQILKTYHFFNFGDHGGILVAVKYFKSKGETYEILYSTDEGETWKSYPFHSTKLKIYGLMTEPNTNSTIFTLFGSQPEEHRWLIIKIDLKNAFTHNCTADDYKFWIPGSQTGDTVIPCLLGLQETYHRRIPHSNCYNGIDYVRPTKTKVCQCNTWDFECDFGFSRLNSNSPCIRNKNSTNFEPYSIPTSCKPGKFYQRTKGYRKIEGDACENGFSSQYLPQTIACPFEEVGEFLIVAQRDTISRINLLNGKNETLPVHGLRNVIAIDFDIKNNCVFWADIISDVIGRQCLNGTAAPEILVESDLASVEGMSYDWVSELLFFVDGTRVKIEAVRTGKEGLGMRTTIVPTKYLAKPRGVVVHPLQGYLYWTDWSSIKPSLSRANLDGSDIKVLFSKPQVVWPNGVTIDFIAERIYWVDASKDYIGSCDLHGKSFKKVIEHDARVAHPFAVAVFKDLIYWDDWKMNSIFSADKDQGIMIHVIADNMASLMDLKFFGHSIQEGKNPCSDPNKCPYLCVGVPNNSYTCLCPDGMEQIPNTQDCLCPGGLKPNSNKTCPQLLNTCAPGYFTCQNKLCIPLLYRCDQEDDCGDKSDEENCSTMKPACPPNMFTCKSDHICIPEYFHCDHDKDCVDGSDELGCTFNQCNITDFACQNGRCISKIWLCDGEDDCRDGSDEKNCTKDVQHALFPCREGEFRCISSGTCIPEEWKCDLDYDCADVSDELDCKNNSSCDPWMFSCGDGHCIYNTWVCDGDHDCNNSNDEKNCSTLVTNPILDRKPKENDGALPACYEWMFKCANSKCIPYWWKCDDVNDCGDFSDEFGCSNTSKSTILDTSSTTTKPIKANRCDSNQFQCDSGICIAKRYVCDGLFDCSHGEDEGNCLNNRKNCNNDNFRCRSDGLCLPKEKYCDKVVNCIDGSDEEDCEKHPNNKIDEIFTCPAGFFRCDNYCQPLMNICDGKIDCYDSSDEKNCNVTQRIYQLTEIGIDNHLINETSFVIYWSLPVASYADFEFMPSISEAGSNKWRNQTTWLSGKQFRFVNLKPYTNYNVTVYVKLKNNTNSYPSFLYSNYTTSEGVPYPPEDLTVEQVNGSRVNISWKIPKETFGQIVGYNIYYLKETQESSKIGRATIVRAGPHDTSLVLEQFFDTNSTYQFWIKAENSKYESVSSKLTRLTLDNTNDMDSISGLKVKSNTSNTIVLEWNPVGKADGYIIHPILPQPYPKIEPFIVKNVSTAAINKISPGGNYVIKVSAFVKKYTGRPSTVEVTAVGEPLPMIPLQGVYHDLNIVRLRWNAVNKHFGSPVTYGVYYGTTLEELYEKPRLKTQSLEAKFNDLLPCESYIFAVGIIEPYGPGPLVRNFKVVETQFNENKPPKNVKATINDDKHEMTITWEHNCPFSEINLSYLINIRETTLNGKPATVQLMSTKNRTMTYILKGIEDGAKYEVTISTNRPEAESVTVLCEARPLPTPRRLTVWPEKNGSFVVYWKEIENLNTQMGHSYEIVAYSGYKTNETIEPFVKLNAKTPPTLINPSDLGGLVSAGKVFTIGVRVKTVQGYVSDIIETEHIELQPEGWFTTIVPSATPTWLMIVPILCICLLAVVIFFIVQRYRKLQKTVSRFSNSHYDTKTGATRIGDSHEDDDRQDLHPTNFDDDEPLVIA